MTKFPFSILILSFVSALAGGFTVHLLNGSAPEPTPLAEPVVHRSSKSSLMTAPVAGPGPAAKAPVPTGALPDFRSASHRALDAVVHVRTLQSTPSTPAWYDWPGFFRSDPGSARIQQGSGSGVILDAEGYIVTNHHVVEGATVIEVGLNDNRSVTARLIGSDPSTDIAVIKIEAEGLQHLEWGDSDALQVGDWVLAIGNPFDLTSTVTAGIVSAKARNIQLIGPDRERALPPVESFIQTDAAVNPGNSGGALVDGAGSLVGINTAIASRTGSYTGYAFAVPANLASKVARDLIEFGAVQRAYLGVNIRPVDEETARSLALPAVSGVLITAVVEGSGAEEAGIAPGDVILSVGGKATATMPELLESVNRYRPGDRTIVELWREGGVVESTVELGTREALMGGAEESEDPAYEEEGASAVVLGCRVQTVRDPEPGVLVLDPGHGPFQRAGIEAGCLIRSVNATAVTDVGAFRDAMAQAAEAGGRGILLEGLDVDGHPAWFGLRID